MEGRRVVCGTRSGNHRWRQVARKRRLNDEAARKRFCRQFLVEGQLQRRAAEGPTSVVRGRGQQSRGNRHRVRGPNREIRRGRIVLEGHINRLVVTAPSHVKGNVRVGRIAQGHPTGFRTIQGRVAQGRVVRNHATGITRAQRQGDVVLPNSAPIHHAIARNHGSPLVDGNREAGRLHAIETRGARQRESSGRLGQVQRIRAEEAGICNGARANAERIGPIQRNCPNVVAVLNGVGERQHGIRPFSISQVIQRCGSRCGGSGLYPQGHSRGVRDVDGLRGRQLNRDRATDAHVFSAGQDGCSCQNRSAVVRKGEGAVVGLEEQAIRNFIVSGASGSRSIHTDSECEAQVSVRVARGIQLRGRHGDALILVPVIRRKGQGLCAECASGALQGEGEGHVTNRTAVEAELVDKGLAGAGRRCLHLDPALIIVRGKDAQCPLEVRVIGIVGNGFAEEEVFILEITREDRVAAPTFHNVIIHRLHGDRLLGAPVLSIEGQVQFRTRFSLDGQLTREQGLQVCASAISVGHPGQRHGHIVRGLSLQADRKGRISRPLCRGEGVGRIILRQTLRLNRVVILTGRNRSDQELGRVVIKVRHIQSRALIATVAGILRLNGAKAHLIPGVLAFINAVIHPGHRHGLWCVPVGCGKIQADGGDGALTGIGAGKRQRDRSRRLLQQLHGKGPGVMLIGGSFGRQQLHPGCAQECFAGR